MKKIKEIVRINAVAWPNIEKVFAIYLDIFLIFLVHLQSENLRNFVLKKLEKILKIV